MFFDVFGPYAVIYHFNLFPTAPVIMNTDLLSCTVYDTQTRYVTASCWFNKIPKYSPSHAKLTIKGIMHGGGGCHVTHSSHNSTYILFLFFQNIPKCMFYNFFSFLFKTFPNALTISWIILIVT